MFCRAVVATACVISLFGCQQSAGGPEVSGHPSAPSVLAAQSVERPWKGQFDWIVTGVQWAGVPGQATSLFEGRCSVLSDYVISGRMEGQVTHIGRSTGETSHCSQITWSPQGPVGAVYSDGRFAIEAPDGSTLFGTYTDGVTGQDSQTGENWFEDTFTITGGTRRFQGATGSGHEGGRFMDFTALLAGTEAAPMWMDGTTTYGPGGGK